MEVVRTQDLSSVKTWGSINTTIPASCISSSYRKRKKWEFLGHKVCPLIKSPIPAEGPAGSKEMEVVRT